MFTTCIFCRKPLGSNEVVETFPVGRRLAFDAARGRLWVVCRRCERWNLTPLEERWEAVEDCERIFRRARMRASTDNIGLARHREGLTLVRIGEPLRPEFAAWRYGDQFGKRRLRTGVCAAGAIGAAAVGGVAIGLAVSFSILFMLLFGTPWGQRRKLVEIPRAGRGTMILRSVDVSPTRLRLSEDGDLRLQVSNYSSLAGRQIWLQGEEARSVAAVILPAINKAGGTKRTVRDAVNLIEAAGTPERLVTDLASADDFNMNDGSPGFIWKMPEPTRLALEMALHEEQERRALEGELWVLEQAWREAEEVAAISDDLLLPAGAEEFLREHGRTRTRRGDRDATRSDDE